VMGDPIRAIADAVLYEGYILWPYRRSALKNQRRFTFGGVYPPAHSAAHPDDRASMRTEVLLSGAGPCPRFEITVRFLQVVQRTVVDAEGTEVDELIVDGERHLSWEEAVEREFHADSEGVHPISVTAGADVEELGDGKAALVRRWAALHGEIQITTDAEPPGHGPGLTRVSVEVRNLTLFPPGGSREEALRLTFCSTHSLLRAREGTFVSLTDPPPELLGAAAACRNVGTWPVLVGDPSDETTMLSSPIILEDHPRIAPESPGDLFDGGEIDQLLVLNILTLTDEEKAEMAASDPRAREILERTEALTLDQLMALHGRTTLR
jgi:hypothetical protein